MNSLKNAESTLSFSLILPVFNEAENLHELYQKINLALEDYSDSYELVFIDDGSTDRSFEILQELQRDHREVRVIRFRRNFGKAAAYSAGFEAARGMVIITMDTDLQNDPEEIPLFLKEIDAGYDMVVGWRVARRDSIEKTLPSRIFNKVVAWVTQLSLRDFNSPFKAFRKNALDEVNVYGELHRYIPVLAHAKGFSCKEIKINHFPRKHGTSKYGIERYLRGMLDLLTVIFITRFSKRPLHLLGTAGVVSFFLGSSVLAFFLVMHILYKMNLLAYHGWKLHDRPGLILGVLLVLLGAQFLSMGLLGELWVSAKSFQKNNKGYSILQVLEDESDNSSP